MIWLTLYQEETYIALVFDTFSSILLLLHQSLKFIKFSFKV